jgi:C-22 sterol desaturase
MDMLDNMPYTRAVVKETLRYRPPVIGAIGHQLEQPGGGGTGCILRSEQEGEDSLGNFIVGESVRRTLKSVTVIALSLPQWICSTTCPTPAPSLRRQVGVGVSLLVVACGPDGGNDHRALGDGDSLADRDWLVFGTGPHYCLGQTYAQLSLMSMIGKASMVMDRRWGKPPRRGMRATRRE